MPASEDWLSWVQEHPYLETTSPQPMSVGGVEGKRLDIRVSSLPDYYYSEDCLGAGVPLWPLLGGHHWCADEGVTTRTIVLESIEGERVIIDAWASCGAFERSFRRRRRCWIRSIRKEPKPPLGEYSQNGVEDKFCELRIDGVLRRSHQVCVSGIIHGKRPVGNAGWGVGGAKHDDARKQGSE